MAMDEFHDSFINIGHELEKKEQVSISQPVHLTPFLEDAYTHVELTLKIGRGNKNYVIKNIPELLRDIKNHNERKYGKDLSIILDYDIFDDKSKALLDLIENRLGGYNSRYIDLTEEKIIDDILYLYQGDYIYFNNELFYSRLEPVETFIHIDKDYLLSLVIPENYIYLPHSRLLIDEKNHLIDVINQDKYVSILISEILSSEYPSMT